MYINILLVLHFIFYEIPLHIFNRFKNKGRDKYLNNVLNERYKEFINNQCLILCQFYFCSPKKSCQLIDIIEYNGIQYNLLLFKSGARVNTEGLCCWRGNVKKCIVVSNTYLDGEPNRNFVI